MRLSLNEKTRFFCFKWSTRLTDVDISCFMKTNNLPKILPPAIILNPQLSTSRSLKAKSATYRLSYD